MVWGSLWRKIIKNLYEMLTIRDRLCKAKGNGSFYTMISHLGRNHPPYWLLASKFWLLISAAGSDSYISDCIHLDYIIFYSKRLFEVTGWYVSSAHCWFGNRVLKGLGQSCEWGWGQHCRLRQQSRCERDPKTPLCWFLFLVFEDWV